MSERYTKLFALPENLYAEGAPLVIAAGSLLKDNQTGKVLAQIKYKSISPKTIKAIKVAVRAFDVSGTALEGIKEYQYLDLSVARDMEFGQKNAIVLPDKVTRSFCCECKSVIFSDGTTWQTNEAKWTPLISPKTLQEKLGELWAQYQRETVRNANFVVTDDRDLWICACGAVNRQNEAKCHVCHCEKSALLTAFDTDILKQHDDVYNKAKAEQEAKKAEEDKKKKAKAKKLGIIAAACAAVLIAALVVITQVVVPSVKYNSAVALMDDGKYAEAITAFGEIEHYQDSAMLLNECEILSEKERIYQSAMLLFEEGNYDEAITSFKAIKGYKNSSQKAAEAEQKKQQVIDAANQQAYLNAEELFKQGSIPEAAISFGKIGNYKEADARSMELWKNISPRKTYYISGQYITALTTDGKLIYRNKLSDKTDTSNVISLLGDSYALLGDGTITRFGGYNGDITYSDLNWSGIVDAIIDDNTLIIGLKNDGTLISDSLKCNLTEYTDIIQIVEFNNYIIALRCDGSLNLIKTDRCDAPGFENWINSFRPGADVEADIIDIKANKHFFWGISRDGSTYMFNSLTNRAWKYDFTVQDFFIYENNGRSPLGILKTDGTVEAPGINNWTDIKEVEASNNCVIGIKNDGSIVTHGNCTCDLSSFTDIFSIHLVGGFKKDNLIGIKNDGTVITSGENIIENLNNIKNIKLH